MKKYNYLVVIESYTAGKTVLGFNTLWKAQECYDLEKRYAEGYPTISVRLLKRKGL